MKKRAVQLEAPKISMIIPVFNQEKYIEECITSIIGQSFSDYEVILVDDASTDKTFEIVQKLIKDDSRFRIISYSENKGTSQARKDAVLSSTGKYILFVDPDDSLSSDACKIAYSYAEKENVDILQFGTNVINCGVNETACRNFINHCAPYPNKIERDTLFFACFEEKLFNFNLWNKIYNADMVRRAFSCVKDGYYPKAQDMYAFVLMSYFSKSYASIDSKLYNYNFGRGITGSRSIKLDRFYKISTQMHIIEQLYKFVDTQHAEDYSHYCDVLKLRGKIFFNEVYANFTYVEDFDSNQDAALGHFLDGLTPVEDEAFENPEIEANYLNALFSYVDELYYNKNVENTKKIFDWATDIALRNKECSIDSMIVKEVNRLMPVLETEKKVIPVVFATNDNYAPYLGATLSSLIAHASDDYVYDVYVFHTSLSELNLFRLTSMSTENVCVRTVNVLPYVKNMRNYSHSHYSVEMYYRILIPEILSQYEKAVYLDCDLILKDDVANLYNVELSDNILAAVINDIVSANMKKYLENTVCIGLDEYFNSGVLVININKFIDNGIKEKCFALLDEYKKLMCPDQDILNISCKGKVLYLTNYWNYQVGSGAFSLREKYLHDYGIIHYTTANKPWNTENLEAGEAFWEYARKTPYYENILSGYLSETLKISNLTASVVEADKKERVRNVINADYHEKSLISWPFRMIRAFFLNLSAIGFKRTMKKVGIKLKYVFGRITGKNDIYNNPVNKKAKKGKVPFEATPIKDYDSYRKLPVSKYKKELEAWYNEKTGSTMDIDNPKSFNQKIQWLKINDAALLKSHLSDKWLAKEYIKAVCGEEYIVKTIGVYDRFEDIDFDSLPEQYVIKSTHGSGQVIVVKDKSLVNRDEVKNKVDKWLSKNYGFSCGFEVHYSNIIPRIIIEEYMEGIKDDLYDYKFMCINGKVEFIWVDSDRFTNHKRNLYDRNWNLLPVKYHHEINKNAIPKPKRLEELISLSEKLAKNFALVRCDFYILPDDSVKFGELTFTSASGIDIWNPVSYDYKFGELLELPKPTPFKALSRSQIRKSELKFLDSLKKK